MLKDNKGIATVNRGGY